MIILAAENPSSSTTCHGIRVVSCVGSFPLRTTSHSHLDLGQVSDASSRSMATRQGLVFTSHGYSGS
jgi:hypothetical protein